MKFLSMLLTVAECNHWMRDAETSANISICPGETRRDRKCVLSPTHRVCAKIGLPDSSFWRFTGQTSWCNTIGYYGGEFGHLPRCPSETPTWCICKWALARWIEGEGCDNIDIECGATDICNLKASYKDYNVELSDAHKCVEQKCPTEWNAC